MVGETILEINLSALKNNVQLLRAKIKKDTMLLAVVKAFAYGSDAVKIAQFLETLGVDYFAVAYIREGVKLREAGVKTPILVLHPHVEKVRELKLLNKINLITPAEVTALHGKDKLEAITVTIDGQEQVLETDHFIPLFGLSPKLGPIANWGLDIEKNAIKVDTLDYQTNIPGVFAIGDVNTYQGKLKLILCGFHEATLMCQSAYKIINPGKRYVLKYTTVSGIDGFDGSRKEAPKAVVQSIN